MMGLWKIFGDTTVDVGGKLPDVTPDTGSIIAWAIAAAGLVAAGFLIKAGFTYVTSQGEPAKAAKAMRTIIYCVVGLVVVILAEAITYFVFNGVGNA